MGNRLGSIKVRREFGKIVSFDSKYRLYSFVFVLLVLYLIPVSIIEGVPDLSVCKKVLGDICPSAGITRGVSSLLKGQIGQAINYNWLSIPTVIVMFSIIVTDIYRKLKNS